VEVIRLLSGMGGRAVILGSHASVHLLSSLMVYKVEKRPPPILFPSVFPLLSHLGGCVFSGVEYTLTL